MSCRSRASSSAVTTLARINPSPGAYQLQDVQVLSIYHQLIRRANQNLERYEAPTRAEWSAFLDRQRIQARRLLVSGQISEARYGSIQSRLLSAADEQPPDAASLYAMVLATPTAQAQGNNLSLRLRQIAEELGQPAEQVYERYTQYQRFIDRNRSQRGTLPPGVRPGAAETSASVGLPPDRGSLYALARLDSEVRQHAAAAAAAGPQRVTRTPASPRLPVRAIGFARDDNGPDGPSGRLEVEMHDGTLLAYRDVPETLARDLMSSTPDNAWGQFQSTIRGNERHQYLDANDATIDGGPRRCRSCGQYANSAHQCPAQTRVPARLDALVNYRRVLTHVAGAFVFGPGASVVDRHARRSPDPLTFTAACHRGTIRTAGTVTVDRTQEGDRAVTVRDLACTCRRYLEDGRCQHTEEAASVLIEQYTPPVRQRSRSARTGAAAQTAEERGQDHEETLRRAQEMVAAQLARDFTRDDAAMAATRAQFASDQEVVFSDDPQAFLTAADAAKARKSAGESPVPFYTGADGQPVLPAGPTGQRREFGVEIEFNLPPGTNRAQALGAIGRDLYDAGLTTSPDRQGYHASQRRGPTREQRGGWTFEYDGSVDGEIVAPIMTDTPEAWQNLQTVCDILKRHGAVAKSTGGHVHVGTGSISCSPAAAYELLRLTQQHEDTLYRVAQNPAASSHRGFRWAKPNPVLPENYQVEDTGAPGVRSAMVASGAEADRYWALNYAHMRKGDASHAEFRLWDGSLDPGVIQAQVKISAALVDAAERNAKTGSVDRGVVELVGSHRARHVAVREARVRGRSAAAAEANQAAAKALAADPVADSASSRALADTLFSRRVDKEQFAALWGVTSWHAAASRRHKMLGYQLRIATDL